MPTDIESQLRVLGERYRSEITRVHPDEILDRAQRTAPVESGPLVALADRPRMTHRRARWLTAVAAVPVLVLIGGLIVISQRDDADGRSNAPAAPTPTVSSPTPTTESPSETAFPAEPVADTEPVPSGALILDQFPAALADAVGYTHVGTAAVSEPPFPANTWVQRWYTTTMDQPELQPRLKLASTSSTQQFPPEIPPRGIDATQATVRGGPAWLYDDPLSGGRSVAFEDEETVFVLTGYQLSDDELLRAADRTMLADSSSVGAVIDAGALPAGLVERAVGTTSETPFVPLETLQHPAASIRWYNVQAGGALPGDDDPMLWLGWRAEDPALFPLHRLDYDTVTDTTVHGVPGFVATNTDPEYLGIVWSESGFTYTLGGWGFDPDTVLATANQLRPATATEWNALESEPG